MSRPRLLALALLPLAAAVPAAPRVPASPQLLRDRCVAEPEYAQFATALRTAVAARDLAKLGQLFAPASSISFEGHRGPAASVLAAMSPAQAAVLFDQLRTMQGLGCARLGPRLFIPGAAVLAEQGGPPEDLLLREATTLRAGPSRSSRAVAMLARGALLTELGSATDPAWTHVASGRKRGYVPLEAVVRTYGYRLEVERGPDGWRIRKLGTAV